MKRSPVLLIVLAVIVILFFWGCNQQRGLATADQNVQTAWSNVETNYQRRTDL
jgi:LemA protein